MNIRVRLYPGSYSIFRKDVSGSSIEIALPITSPKLYIDDEWTDQTLVPIHSTFNPRKEKHWFRAIRDFLTSLLGIFRRTIPH